VQVAVAVEAEATAAVAAAAETEEGESVLAEAAAEVEVAIAIEALDRTDESVVGLSLLFWLNAVLLLILCSTSSDVSHIKPLINNQKPTTPCANLTI